MGKMGRGRRMIKSVKGAQEKERKTREEGAIFFAFEMCDFIDNLT